MGLFKRDPDAPPGYDDHVPPPPEKENKGGARLSMGPPQPQAGPSNAALYACLMLCQNDRVRLLNFPPHITEVIRQTLAVAWPVGLQADAPYGPGCHEFKLKGNPCECEDLMV